MPPMSTTVNPGKPTCLAAACLLVAFQSGCTSALTTAYLRDGLWAGSEHASSTGDDDATPRDDAHGPHGEPAPIAPAPAVDRERREAALEEAMARLSHLGPLDPAVEAALVATLQRTQPEDWPVVVEEFAASLATAPVASPTPVAAREAVADVRAAAEPRPAVPGEAAPASAAPSAEAQLAETTSAETTSASSTDDTAPAEQADAAGPSDPASPPPAPVAAAASAVEPPLAVRSACFASAVRAWGDVDRFTADRFRPGQDVIVYVELDNLSAGASPTGHTTCIDAVLRLVDDTGSTLHTWSFDPVAETSPTRRRDYFARYVVHVPESAPAGQCRVEVDVIDTRSGATARTAIPLEIAGTH